MELNLDRPCIVAPIYPRRSLPADERRTELAIVTEVSRTSPSAGTVSYSARIDVQAGVPLAGTFRRVGICSLVGNG